MKKFAFLLFLLAININIVIGSPIDTTLAKVVAENFYFQNNPTQMSIINNTIEINLVYTRTEGGSDIYYVYNVSNNSGWIIVAGDNAVLPILAYSDEGSYSIANQPPAFVEWMNAYKDEILYVKQNSINADITITNKWNQLISNTINQSILLVSVSPLLSTTWAQDCYYNAQCPYDGSGDCNHALTGCVATAMAQILKYWEFPTTGIGSHSYTHSTYGTLSANFGTTTYNWGSMPNNVTSTNSAVATLMYHCGVSVEMDYGPTASGATTSDVVDALIDYFGYQNSAEYRCKVNYTSTSWKNLLKQELDESRPIQYRGSGSGGHSFVCDGYDNSDYFHFNWGWSGSYNGYFAIGDLTPASQDFNTNNCAIVGIMPGSPGGDDFSVQNCSVTPGSVYDGATIDVSSEQCYSGSTLDANMGSSYLGYYLSTNTSFSSSVDTYLGYDASGLGSDDPCNSESETLTIPAGTLAGTYYILFVADYDDTFSETDENNNVCYYQLNVTNNIPTYVINTSSNPVAGGSTSGSGTYASGYNLILGATANNGYSFVDWTENGMYITDIPFFPLTVSSNRTFVANFTQNPVNYTIATSSNPSAGGSTSGGGTYVSGSSCTVTATANSGYTFTNWTESGSTISTNASYSFIVSVNRGLVANFTQSGQTIDLNNGLVAYYPFNGNANDASGNGNHGTVNGASLTTDRFCNANSAYNFAGISNPQTISVANSSTLQFSNAATFSFWISMNSYQGMDGWGSTTANGYHVIYAKDYDQCCITGGIGGLSNGEFTAHCGTGPGGIGLGDTVSNSAINQWINITYVITTTNVSIYANGNLIASQTGSMSFANSNTKNLWFGRLSSYWYPFNGKMDDIRIYNRALNLAEIQAIHNLGSGIPSNGLVAQYPFNGNANDESGNGNNGIIQGNVISTSDRLGNANSAYEFPGVAFNYIQVPDAASLHLNVFSLSAWIYSSTDYGSGQVIQKNRDVDNGHYGLYTTSIGATNLYGGINNTTAISQPTIGTWHMVSGTVTGSTAKFYLDGQFVKDTTLSNPYVYSGSEPLAIGMHYFSGVPSIWTYPFKGKIDDILIYNRVLSDAEVLQIYQSSNSVIGLPSAAGTIAGTATVCQGQNSVTYTVPLITNATSYVWTLPGGATGTSTTNSITVNYGASATSGNITVMGINPCGNGTASTIAITVTVCTNVQDNETSHKVNIYPNPVSGELTIEIEENKDNFDFEIYNSIGQLVYKGNLIEKTVVQTSSFAPGVFLIKLENGKMFEVQKIIKE
ncbi:MAG TPA: C10 family peptidase [Paludibacteraceae bacterium]|nr:C10 family peptidase [Paludibacteraceae bacterium]